MVGSYITSTSIRNNAIYLVIAPEQRHVTWIFQFQAQQEAEGLDRIMSPIHEVAKENVRRIRGFPPDARTE